MFRTRLLLSAVLYCTIASAQTKTIAEASLPAVAKVNVIVTDMKGKASKGEQINFIGESTSKFFSGHSDATGKLSLQLPAGEKYIISVKSLADSTQYGVIDIPALEAGQFFTDPFTVDIKFEPARTYRLDNVHFDIGKATLRTGSSAALEDLFTYLKNKEATRVEIGGHTDNAGKDIDNLKLSQQRAETIRNYLIKKGIQPNRVIAKGYGATLPVAGNDTEEGRQANRRTEVKIL